MRTMHGILALGAIVAVAGCSGERETQATTPASSAPAAATKPAADLAAKAKACDAALGRAAEWLLAQQLDDGTFGKDAKIGKTGLVLSALLAARGTDAFRKEPRVKKALDFVVQGAQPDGSINSPGEKGLANYQTSAALAALAAFNDPAHAKIRKAAADFLVSIQNLPSPDDPNYGSWGYNRDKRGDLSNTQFTLEALKAAGLDENDEAFKRCRAFLERCQNRSESSDQEFATNDGGAMYYPGRSNAGVIALPNGKVIYKSYGSMTYALLRAYVLCGLKPDDPRVRAAQKWITENYTVAENPGMDKGKELQGLYYYYLSMAKALALLQVTTLKLPDGTEANWAADLGDKLVSLQRPEGYWINEAMRWMENDKVLCTAYAVLALSECRDALATSH